jgi:hypothetical protein
MIEVAGTTSDWIGYYAGVSSSIISSTMAFTILIINYKQNEKNHKDLKLFQINNSTYALERKRLSQIESVLKKEMFLLSPYRLSEIAMKDGELSDNFIPYINKHNLKLLRTEEEANFFHNVYRDLIDLARLTTPRSNLSELFNKATTDIRECYQNSTSKEKISKTIDLLQKRMDGILKSSEYITYRKTVLDIIREAEDKLDKKMLGETTNMR